MKKVINGKVYNTDTSKMLCGCSGGEGSGRYSESIYRTPRGNFFLVGRGGPASHWRESVGLNTWGEGSGLRVLSVQEAKEWVEKHDQDLYQELFPVEEG